MSLFPAILNAILGLVVLVSVVLAVLHYQDELDLADRTILAGLAGSMIIVSPALWISHTPFDPWAFNLSRAFFAAFCVKRFLVPVVWGWKARQREGLQLSQSGRRIADRKRHKL